MNKPKLRPDVEALLSYLRQANLPEIQMQTPEEARAIMLATVPQTDLEMPAMAVQKKLFVPGSAGPISALLLDVQAERESGVVVIWFHGGGFVSGSIDTHKSFAAAVCQQLNLPVLLVDYRLAPEAPYPAAVQDAESITRWVAESPAELGFYVDALVLGGDSAGGTLATVTAIALRDSRARVPVLCQILLYPGTDFTRDFPSHTEFSEGYLLTRAGQLWYRDQYQPQNEQIQASPLLADLTGLPTTVILTSGVDPVRDEGRAYAAKLAESGVPTTFLEAEGMIHAFVLLRKVLPSANQDIVNVLDAARVMLQTTLLNV